MKKIILIVFIGIFVSVVALFGAFYFNFQGVCRTNCNPQVFVVPQGATLNSILDKLEKEKIIRNSFVAKIYIRLSNFKGQIQAGDFKLNPKDDVSRIIATLQKGTLDFWVTIPEGWRAEQIYEKILSNTNKYYPILTNTNKKSVERDVEIYKQNEGYLFPDTYLIPKNASDKNVVSIMRNNFDAKINPIIRRGGSDDPPQGQVVRPVPTTKIKINNGEEITLQELIILASLVEREAKNEVERPIIAGIIYKRRKAGWPLQIDATVQYAIGVRNAWWKKELTIEDLKINSPYNTYIIKGLPPSPICNPGLAAIDAVVNQKLTDYWYYSTGNDGITRYSVTLQGHNTNVDKFINK